MMEHVPSGFDCYTYALKNYVKFDGRARRREYWLFFLFNFLITIGISIIDMLTGSYDPDLGLGTLGTIYGLLVLLPGIALAVRRLHDTGRSGWWLLLILIPFIGALILLIFFVLDSNEEGAKYGPPRK